jgi:hypothetical protein
MASGLSHAAFVVSDCCPPLRLEFAMRGGGKGVGDGPGAGRPGAVLIYRVGQRTRISRTFSCRARPSTLPCKITLRTQTPRAKSRGRMVV